jgi:hypothetical protein
MMLMVAPCESRFVRGAPVNLVSAAFAEAGTNKDPSSTNATTIFFIFLLI